MYPGMSKSRYLVSDTVLDRLAQRTIRGGVVTAFSQSCTFAINLGRTAILARLLTPDDFGLIGMVAVVTGFVMLFKDAGLSMATIQRKEITHEQISNLFWVNAIISIGCMVIVAALAPLVTWFYGREELLGITIALAGAIIFSGLVIQHQALLRRRMEFGRLALVQVASQLAGAIAAIVLAWFGFRYWALVWSQYVLGMFGLVAFFVACPWWPGWLSRGSGVRSMLHFGKNLTGFNFVNFFARNGDNLLIGKFCGSAQLGIYSRAYALLMLPLSQINGPLSAAAIPALSRLQDDPQRYRHYYLSAIRLICAVSMPFVVFLMAMATNVILIVLGPQWTEAAGVFFWLGVTGVLQPVNNTGGWLLVSQGRDREMFQWGILGSTLIVASFAIGIPWGIQGVAMGYGIVCATIVTPLQFWWIGRKGPVQTRDFYRELAVPLVVSLCLLVVLLVAHRAQWIQNVYLETVVAALATSVVAAILLLRNRNGRQLMQRIIAIGIPARWRSCLQRSS